MRKWRAEHPERNRATDRRSRERNREKRYAATQAWRERNRGYIAEYAARYQSENRESLTEKSREYRRENRDKVLKWKREWARRNPEKTAEMIRNARAKKPDQYRERDKVHEQRRRARKVSSNPAGVSVAEWEARAAEFNGCCAYCNEPTPNPVMEHMDPLVKGGLHHISNVVPSCARCNMAKHTLTVLEFLTGFRLDRKAEVAI